MTRPARRADVPPRRADVVVVGGGSSGCVVASRLSEDPNRTVVLFEAGQDLRSAESYPADISSGTTLPVGPDSPWIGTYPSELTPGQSRTIARGRVLGGSGAVNGGYFVRARPSDFALWPQSLWSFDQVLPYFVRSETDLDLTAPWHGDAGPIPVSRIAAENRHPVTEAFHAAAADAGFADDPDKNDPSSPGGIGPVPSNIRGGVRVNSSAAYLLPHLDRPNLTVEGDSTVRGLVFRGSRVIGVDVTIGGVRSRVLADTIVLCAGAVLTPQLLMLSGIGPAEALTASGISVVVDSPRVGTGFSDHPEVGVSYRVRPDAPDRHPTALLEEVLHVDGLEIRPYTVPFDRMIPGLPPGNPMIGVGLMIPDSRGAITLQSGDPAQPPFVNYGYLRSPSDRAALTAGVDLVHHLLSSPHLAGIVDGPVVRGGDPLVHLGTSLHLSGSCALGVDGESVLDERCRVRGVEGLFVADTSAIPVVPSRGPHATAIMLAERVSTFIAA